ncbi:MAG: hypothetical protein WCX46_01365 [Candidatus Paceibacterota bacterium]
MKNYKKNRENRLKVHENIKKIGYDKVLKMLQDKKFPNPEKLARELLEDPKENFL